MDTQRPIQKIEISTFTLVKVVLFILALWFLWFIKDILLLLFIVLILVAVFHPFVDRLHKAKVPRVLAIIFLYVILFGILVLTSALIAPVLTYQIKEFIGEWPNYIERFSPAIDSVKNLAASMGISSGSTTELLSPVTGNIYGWTIGFIGTIVSSFIVLLLTFYLLLEKNGTKAFWFSFVPEKKQHKAVEILNKIATKWGAWLRARVILSIIVGILTYIALISIGLPFALTLAVWLALMDFIPFIGPWIGALPAIVVAFAFGGWVLALIVLLIYFIIQLIENSILLPKIMAKSMGISPVAVIVAVLIGAKLLGLIGVILAVPVAAGLAIIWPELKSLMGYTHSDR